MFGGGTDSVLVGVLRSSQDEQGRRYPFGIVCALSEGTVMPPHRVYLPVQCRAFFDEATSLAQKATAGEIAWNALRTHLERLPEPRVRPSVPRQHKQYLRREAIGNLEAALREGAGPAGRRVARTVTVLRRPGRLPDDGLRCPLVDRGQPSGSLVSFWAALAARLPDEVMGTPTLFWTDPSSVSSMSDLLLYAGTAAPEAVSEVLRIDPRPTEVGTVDGPPGASDLEGLDESCPADTRLWDLLH